MGGGRDSRARGFERSVGSTGWVDVLWLKPLNLCIANLL